MEEKKNNLITIRMDDEDRETLDYLSDHMGRTMSDTILRACKFFSSTGETGRDVDIQEKGRKNRYVHMRVSDSDLEFLNKSSDEADENVSKFVRKAVKAYYNSMKGVY